MTKNDKKFGLVILAVIGLFLLSTYSKTTVENKDMSIIFLDKYGKEVKPKSTGFATISVGGLLYENVKYMGFTINTKNTGNVGLEWTIMSLSNNVVTKDFSGDLYNALKNTQSTPVKCRGNVDSTCSWNTITKSSCDSSEVLTQTCCAIPIDDSIGGHSPYSELCKNGDCTWSVKVVSDSIDPSSGQTTGVLTTRVSSIIITNITSDFQLEPNFDVTVAISPLSVVCPDEYEIESGETHPEVICPGCTLNVGWNNVIYKGTTQNIASAIAPISGKVSMIWYWTGEDMPFYDSAYPGLSTLATLENGKCYAFQISNSTSW